MVKDFTKHLKKASNIKIKIKERDKGINKQKMKATKIMQGEENKQ